MTAKKKAAVVYPREDTCSECGVHLGWVLNEQGEDVALGICEDCYEDEGEEGDDAG